MLGNIKKTPEEILLPNAFIQLQFEKGTFI